MNVKEEEEEENVKIVNETVVLEDAAMNDDEEEDDMVTSSSSSSHPGSPDVRNHEEEEVNQSSNGNIQINLFEDGDMEEDEENEDLGKRKELTKKKQEDDDEKKEISSVIACADLSSDSIVLPTFVSDRFRNAWIRVRQNPLTDTEAWKALITEAGGFKEEERITTSNWTKLDLLESVYGALLNYFPYSPYANSAVMEFLFSLSADDAFVVDGTISTSTASIEVSKRRAAADLKLTTLIQTVLGVQPTTTTTTTTTEEEEEDKDARSKVRSNMLKSHGPLWNIYIQKVSRDTQRKYSSIYAPEEARQIMIQAFETALHDNNLMVVGAHLIWRQYISYLQYEEPHTEETTTTTTTKQQQQRLLLRQVYQRCIAIPMQDLDIFWQEYTSFERHISEVLSQPLLAEHLPKYQHAKQVYVERLAYLQTTPELLVSSSSSSLSANTTTQHYLRLLSIPPDNSEKERLLLRSYFQRIAYERTNPERLSSAELVKRVRQAYKDTICIFMRHVEVWQDWATFEHAAHRTNTGVDLANEIYTFGMEFCSSALLAASHSELLECAGQIPAAIHIMDNFCTQHPCSLGFIVLQRITRRTQGIQAARTIFKRARQTLLSPPEDTLPLPTTTTTTEQSHSKPSSEAGDATMVTEWTMSRIKPKTSTVSTTNVTNADATKMNSGATTTTSTTTTTTNSGKAKSVGYITWHLYASHAHMELRCNKCPQVAARVFELGLSKHRSFITCPSYIQAYSQLLLERGDDDNMRSLLERAIAACQQEGKSRNRQRLLWDMLLEFECNDAQTFGDPKIIRTMEARRCRALPPEYDTATESDHLPKALQEQLARVDGENAGLISGGLGRLLRRFELIGLLGSGGEQDDISALLGETSDNAAATYGGRKSDASFAYRYHGISSQSELSGVATMGAGLMDRSRAARERAQAATGQPQTLTAATKFTDALHPEWLRTLLSMLPVQRMQRMNARPPPHMIEMALAALRTRALPATRPAAVSTDTVTNPTTGRKRRLGDDDDSSDDGTDVRIGGGGYSAQFRMRQRARQEASSF